MKIYVVGDSSSLILLVRSNLHNYLLPFTKIIIPEVVYQEILKGKIKNKKDAFIIEKLVFENKIIIENSNKTNIENIKYISKLGEGELHAIALAKQKNYPILIDDKKGINVCILLNIKYLPILAILNMLFDIKIINKEQTINSFNILIKNGFFKKEIIEKYYKIFNR